MNLAYRNRVIWTCCILIFVEQVVDCPWSRNYITSYTGFLGVFHNPSNLKLPSHCWKRSHFWNLNCLVWPVYRRQTDIAEDTRQTEDRFAGLNWFTSVIFSSHNKSNTQLNKSILLWQLQSHAAKHSVLAKFKKTRSRKVIKGRVNCSLMKI